MSIERNDPRIAFPISPDKFDRLNELLGTWGTKTRLYTTITVELIKILETLKPRERSMFIAAISDEGSSVKDWYTLAEKVRME